MIREVRPDGTITTVAGNGSPGYSGGGGPATSALLFEPEGVAVDSQGDIFIADSIDSAVRVVRPDGIITTLTTISSALGLPPGTSGPNGDDAPTGLAVDAQGDLYIVVTDDYVILEVQPDGNITDVAGDIHNQGYWGDGGPPTSAALFFPGDVAVDSSLETCLLRTVETDVVRRWEAYR